MQQNFKNKELVVKASDKIEDLYNLKEYYWYSCSELALILNIDAETVRRIFLKEPGVIVFRNQAPGKRIYRLIRIPGSVAIRVVRRFTLGEQVAEL